jgi:hyperosmotically inducible periplasmic protein
MKRSGLRSWLLLAGLSLALGGCAGTGKQESTGEFVDDTIITTKVKTALIDDREVRARNISVATFKGVVHLSGTTADAHESWKAAQIARNVKGVKAVRNDIVVK